ncbi:UNVERIFIED_CONTAM: hypothetical protein FKN15_074706 [Acipenser sinensis]
MPTSINTQGVTERINTEAQNLLPAASTMKTLCLLFVIVSAVLLAPEARSIQDESLSDQEAMAFGSELKQELGEFTAFELKQYTGGIHYICCII